MKIDKLFCLFILTFPVLLKAQSDYKSKDTVNVKDRIHSYFSDIHLEQEKDSLEIVIDTITEGQFSDFKSKENSMVDIDSSRISFGNNSFYLRAADTVFVFNSSLPRPWHVYHGYYIDLDSYLIGVNWGIYDLFLISKRTAKGLLIPAFFDSALDPLISPDNRYMLIYGTCGSPPEYCLEYSPYVSILAVIEISNKDQLQDFNSYKTFDTKDWNISDIVWIDDSNLAIKTYEDRNKNGLINVNYLKVKIKEGNTGANKK